ncbi:phage major capsid protein [Cupriavidus gilardii]|uniref:phage major capsid protein n=1 Tax=Cupriavidus gilardii TaxID=82541 RepID=UPI0021B2A1FE|nr:phage major capsid protein [Cupriavidus gilardii]UXC37105.1 phage major capsid protein [Cupriavidus gilardii]
MKRLHEIREAKAGKVAEMRAMLAKAETEKRSLTSDEQSKFDAIKAEITALEGEEQRAQYIDDLERRMTGQRVEGGGESLADLERRVSVLDVMRAAMEGRALSGAAAEYHAETERRTGRKAQGVFVPMRALEQRVSTTASAPELVPTDHRADLYIEPFRNALLARRLGVRVLSNLTGNLSIPKYGTGTTVGWVAENSALTPSDMAFESVSMSPKHAGGITEMSRQLLQQSSPDIEQLVRSDLSAMLAQAIDSAIIMGGGANEPDGVLSTAGIQTASLATLDWDGVLAMLEKLELANAAAANWLTSPRVKKKLASTLKSASAGASYLLERGQMADLPLYSTNQTPEKAGTPNTGRLILGDWSQVMLGIWSEIDLLVNPYAESAYSKGNVLVRAMATVDIALRHPEGFVVADDVAL